MYCIKQSCRVEKKAMKSARKYIRNANHGKRDDNLLWTIFYFHQIFSYGKFIEFPEKLPSDKEIIFRRYGVYGLFYVRTARLHDEYPVSNSDISSRVCKSRRNLAGVYLEQSTFEDESASARALSL